MSLLKKMLLVISVTLIIAFGLLGLVMKKYGYSRPALLLGFVLGGLFERYLLLSLKIYGPSFFLTPISLSLLAITVLMLNYRYLARIVSWSRGMLAR